MQRSHHFWRVLSEHPVSVEIDQSKMVKRSHSRTSAVTRNPSNTTPAAIFGNVKLAELIREPSIIVPRKRLPSNIEVDSSAVSMTTPPTDISNLSVFPTNHTIHRNMRPHLFHAQANCPAEPCSTWILIVSPKHVRSRHSTTTAATAVLQSSSFPDNVKYPALCLELSSRLQTT